MKNPIDVANDMVVSAFVSRNKALVETLNNKIKNSTFTKWQLENGYSKGYLDALENLKLELEGNNGRANS